ncbi:MULTISPECIES: type IV secretion system protein [Rhizobium/Agrobacterium group]|uniref:Type IV secretion system protein VirB6 n=3 Tax=Agrobacterium tumefaciens TaxID=358 RepID=VIRB6_AGRT9|nr:MULTISPECIES: type IV secretion system protein [Rhizobium/Agrobacterium group]P05356.1 RecName: Full=Protein VirB6 [Agrobacterium tumefaciens (strain 15955)]AHK05286.1 type IV transport system to transfer T-DNA and Vir proteins from bacteria to host cytoplasm [Agrobacterium tumefaciens LBA4213 (Ach5)]AKC11014.1 type IV secretion system protein VirB6 [Agrobacterium tumefaciens]AAF77166.1 virB6 [Agrobacterium tumefaciens]ASK41635.1 protein VirB6 [Agrobacterium tumefaciens]ASK42788.1 protein 
MNFTIPAPFTAIHTIFDVAFTTGLDSMLETIQEAVSAPLIACVTLWIIVQGILVIRGEVDTRSGITRVITVTIVVALIVGQANYQDYVVSIFEKTVPIFVQQFSVTGLPLQTVPAQLDTIFAVTQAVFQKIASEIGPMNDQDILAFQGAQWVLYGTLWSAFGVYDAVGILTKVLLAIGPLILVGYIFDRTRDIAAKWIGQLITYGLLLLLLNLVATIVILTEATALTLMLGVITFAGTTAAKIIGLYELDMFFLTGDALIVALPAIAGNIGGSYWSGATQSASSLYRRFAQVERG